MKSFGELYSHSLNTGPFWWDIILPAGVESMSASFHQQMHIWCLQSKQTYLSVSFDRRLHQIHISAGSFVPAAVDGVWLQQVLSRDSCYRSHQNALQHHGAWTKTGKRPFCREILAQQGEQAICNGNGRFKCWIAMGMLQAWIHDRA